LQIQVEFVSHITEPKLRLFFLENMLKKVTENLTSFKILA
jgi:hypothetical protein